MKEVCHVLCTLKNPYSATLGWYKCMSCWLLRGKMSDPCHFSSCSLYFPSFFWSTNNITNSITCFLFRRFSNMNNIKKYVFRYMDSLIRLACRLIWEKTYPVWYELCANRNAPYLYFPFRKIWTGRCSLGRPFVSVIWSYCAIWPQNIPSNSQMLTLLIFRIHVHVHAGCFKHIIDFIENS